MKRLGGGGGGGVRRGEEWAGLKVFIKLCLPAPAATAGFLTSNRPPIALPPAILYEEPKNVIESLLAVQLRTVEEASTGGGAASHIK